MNPITACCAAVLMLGLAACGSDSKKTASTGDGGMTMPMPMPMPVAVDMSGVSDDAARPAGTTVIAAGASATVGDVTFTCAGAACTVIVAADGSATATGGTVTAANSAAYTEAATKRAETKETEITAEGAQTADAGLGGSTVTATGNAEGAYNVEIEREGDVRTITVRVEGATDDDDVTFTKAEDLTGAAGHVGQMQTRTMDADMDDNVITEVAVVYTDIDAADATPFGEVHDLDIRVDGETATDAMPNDALNVVDANLAHVKADRFKAPAGTTATTVLSFQQLDGDTAAAEIPGTYEGAAGTYKCNATGAACSVTVNDMGEVSAVSNDDDWIFIPASGATVDVPDSDYLHYGFWLKRTTDSDGVVTYNEVETFAGSSVAASGSVASVRGSATYEGGAAGVYVHKTFATDGTSEATSGHFSADARLTATFGQTTADDPGGEGQIPPNQLNTLTGTINNFVLSGGETQGWSVELEGGITTADGTVTSADGATGDGAWNATFHGPTGDDNTDKPSSVVGEFNADFSNGSVAGAFGATQKDD